MSDQPDQVCNNCGTAFTGEATGGLCPRCLLEMNLASRTMPGGEASPQVPPPSPEEIADRFPQFEILECLGRGGMGIVYKARQKALDRLVAIKVLAGERRDEPQFEARFSREAQTLAKLSHPNIVTVHDFGESDGMFYLVMEFVDGVNLRDVLCDGRMESEQALAIVPEICEALQFAHERGIVHRDIKPENILMDRDGRIKIADFGIATLVGASGERSGTPPYMAPEQGEASSQIDHRADIYALGVVFYEMLTGERPEGDPTRPSRQVEIDVRLDEIVLRALEKEPEQRYQTAGEFRTMVQTMGEPDGVSAAGPPPGWKGRWRGVDRRSKRTLFGLPLWHVASGTDPATGKPRTARGIIAIGDRAEGVVAIGGVAVGGFAFGGFSIGVVSLGGFSAGLFAMGGFALGLLMAFGGFAMAPIAIGGVALGYFTYAGQGFGVHVASAKGVDPEARLFFDSWADSLMQFMRKYYVACVVSLLLVSFAVPWWLRRRFEKEIPQAGESPASPPSETTRRRSWEVFSIFLGTVFLVAMLAFTLEWSGPFRGDLLVICSIGLGICALSIVGYWPIRSPIFPDPNFSSRNTRRCRALVERSGEAAPRKQPWVLLPLFGIALLVAGLGVWGLIAAYHSSWGSGASSMSREKADKTMPSIPRTPHAAVLPDGSFVEIVSLMHAGSDPGGDPNLGGWFWQPDGSKLEIEGEADWSFTPSSIHRTSPAREGLESRAVVVRWGGPSVADPTLLGWEFNGRPGSHGSFFVTPRNESARAWLGLVFNYPAGTDLASLRFLMASGPFTHGPSPGRVWGKSGTTPYGSFLIGKVFDRDGTAAINLTHDLRDCDFRVRARHSGPAPSGMIQKGLREISNELGKRDESQWVVGRRVEGSSGNGQVLEVFEFPGLAPGSSLVTGLEVRPARWVEIRNVSLNSGKRSHPKVNVSANTPEQVAFEFMKAIRKEDLKGVLALLNSDVGGRDLGNRLAGEGGLARIKEDNGGKLDRMTVFTEWHRESGYAIARTDYPPGDDKSACLILALTPNNGWRVSHLGGFSRGLPLAYKLEQAKRHFLELDRTLERRRKYGPPVDMDAIDENIAVEEEALHFLVAIREKDEAKLRALCIARVEGWADAMVGHFSMELRERFRQDTGEEFTLYPGKSLVDGSLAVVQCVAAKELQPKLDGGVLVLHFTRTANSGWKVWTIRKARESQPLEEHLEQARKWAAEWEEAPEGAEGSGKAEFRNVGLLPVTPPATMPEGSPLTVEQMGEILEGVTWDKFLTAFADDGHEHEVRWKMTASEEGKGTRFEVTFPFRGEKMRLDLAPDPEFKRATPSRLRSEKDPDKILADPGEFLTMMALHYAMQSGHPAVAPALVKIQEGALGKARQAMEVNVIRSYAAAIISYQTDHGSFPPDLQTLVDRNFLPEAMLMKNHQTAKMEMPLYFGGPDLKIASVVDHSKYNLLAAPSADQANQRIVGFLDAHVEVLDEADYQRRLKAQQE